MANQYIKNHQEEVDKAIEHLKSEIAGLRTGRANPAMVENLHVEVYGAKTPLIQVASISVPEARVLKIEPWDKSLVKDIEKAINTADIGIQATVDGTTIRIIIPQMTEENRKDLVKLLKERHERARISVRSIRDKVKEEILAAEKANELTEDDRYQYLEELDKQVTEWNKSIDALVDAKENEIMTV
jgi:ribosome recycling factor